ncbi:Methionyl-tRNA formyltransferase [Pseudoalteromonas luteoviolacea B = ATCC 29581]|nr:Methionyl-tRNA formyltransferase [Pseudoalteromonas luteoviolacea B = ATCC 29581]
MNILVLANYDLAACFALNCLLPKLFKSHHVTLWLSQSVGNPNTFTKPITDLGQFERSVLESGMIDNHALPLKRFDEFTRLASKPKIVNSINCDESLAQLSALDLDVIVSIRYGCILKDMAIAQAKLGVINLHSGILPSYRGVMATFWAMLNNDNEIGTTLHAIDSATIDTGKIFKISKRPLDKSKSYLHQVLSLYPQGINDMLEAIDSLSQGHSLTSFPQENTGCYFTFPTEQNLTHFEQRGMTFVNEREIQALLDQVMA